MEGEGKREEGIEEELTRRRIVDNTSNFSIKELLSGSDDES